MGNQHFNSLDPPLLRGVYHLSLADLAEHNEILHETMPKLRDLREDVFFQAEYQYLQNLVSLTGRNIRKACELSGLSRSRLYTLLKKYQISSR
jgi:transcriptional regulator of acetoin/glycerol metabolism